MPKAIVMPETDFDFLNVLALRADASAVWVATDVGGEGTLWRIPL
jgi:3-dehydroquinate dehydratase